MSGSTATVAIPIAEPAVARIVVIPVATALATPIASTVATAELSERMVKRYAKKAGLPNNLSPHSLRVAVATDLLDQGVALADVQYLLGHADPRTTRLYDRRHKQVTRNIVERIRLGS